MAFLFRKKEKAEDNPKRRNEILREQKKNLRHTQRDLEHSQQDLEKTQADLMRQVKRLMNEGKEVGGDHCWLKDARLMLGLMFYLVLVIE
jgi:hypothetical protein